jgi:hypothetical protein
LGQRTGYRRTDEFCFLICLAVKRRSEPADGLTMDRRILFFLTYQSGRRTPSRQIDIACPPAKSTSRFLLSTLRMSDVGSPTTCCIQLFNGFILILRPQSPLYLLEVSCRDGPSAFVRSRQSSSSHENTNFRAWLFILFVLFLSSRRRRRRCNCGYDIT